MSPIGCKNFDFSRNIDIVMCIDATRSMQPVIEDIKAKAFSFRQELLDEFDMADPPTGLDQLRIKVIVFGGRGEGLESIAESKFFVLDEEVEAFQEFVNGIRVTEGDDGANNSLAALALAMKSDWVQTGSVHRHVIIMFTAAPALPLSVCAGQPGYPEDMPKNLVELKTIWDEKMEKRAKRLLIFAPKCESWSDMDDWQNTFYTACQPAAYGDVDISTCLHLVAQST